VDFSMSRRRPIIVGNWKMNKTIRESVELATEIKKILNELPELEVGIAPHFLALQAVEHRIDGTSLQLVAQNCHYEKHGAYTGEISAPMLADIRCRYVIIGHSERRQYFGENDELVNGKVLAVLKHGLRPILCLGEQLVEREAGATFEVVERQLLAGLANVPVDLAAEAVVAYEPVWAIGTGKVATAEQAQEVHAFLRGKLAGLLGEELAQVIRIQYGGSVKPDNIGGLMAQPDIDGALVGGASLMPEDFIAVLRNSRGP
jgi:triosephosphate isomerase